MQLSTPWGTEEKYLEAGFFDVLTEQKLGRQQKLSFGKPNGNACYADYGGGDMIRMGGGGGGWLCESLT